MTNDIWNNTNDRDWKTDLSGFLARIPGGLRIDQWATTVTDRPGENLLGLLGLSTVLFYLAERKTNPKVNDVWDSLVYCSTCFSVGYGDIFAKTPLGKILGSLLMTVGPAMAARAFDGPPPERCDPKLDEVLDTLKQILAELKAKSPAEEYLPT